MNILIIKFKNIFKKKEGKNRNTEITRVIYNITALLYYIFIIDFHVLLSAVGCT